MSSLVASEPVPLTVDADGVRRVGGTRVPLETVVAAFVAGGTPEEIAQDFPVLRLDDIYAVITYYLRHRTDVSEYVATRRRQGAEVRERIEGTHPQTELRDRLLARLGS